MAAYSTALQTSDEEYLPKTVTSDSSAITASAREASDLLKALAHEGRLVIIALLAERERSVTELENLLDLRQPAVSQQLARLRADHLVTTRREGKLIYYSLASNAAADLVNLLAKIYPAK